MVCRSSAVISAALAMAGLPNSQTPPRASASRHVTDKSIHLDVLIQFLLDMIGTFSIMRSNVGPNAIPTWSGPCFLFRYHDCASRVGWWCGDPSFGFGMASFLAMPSPTRDGLCSLDTRIPHPAENKHDSTATTRALANPSWPKAKDRAQDDLEWRQKRKSRLRVDTFGSFFSRLFCLAWPIVVHQVTMYAP
jgi:hypothetical protein